MPPKRRAASKAKPAGKPPKVAKQSTLEKAIDQLQQSAKADAKGKAPKKYTVDKQFPHSNAEVYGDYACMLNQTNIGHNNNKFYVVQVLRVGTDDHYAFTRWGRVGEPGSTQLFGPFLDVDDAIAQFEKKFQDKTKNKWTERAKFKPAAGKYTMIDIGDDDDDDEQEATESTLANVSPTGKVAPSKLDKDTQDLIKLILDRDMFKNAMAKMEIDVKKMPLGKLSKEQIIKGFQVLDELQKVIKKEKKGNMTELSSQFYTIIPHDFGRQRPPVIDDADHLRRKLDMLITLSDIELAQGLMKKRQDEDAGKKKKGSAPEPHPLDKNYEMLKCSLNLIKPGSAEHKVVSKYFEKTRSGYPNKLLAVWRMDREAEDKRFAAHNKLANRKLLWHGTNVAVVAAIMKTGLRIMPHSGGRVGAGIYFASECAKSAGYVCPDKNIGIMFLNEVALGKEKPIARDDSSLRAPPPGFDSVVAMGRTEPDEKEYEELELDGNKVTVPAGRPVTRSQYQNSSFSQSEYLVYKESQVRMRYLLKCQF